MFDFSFVYETIYFSWSWEDVETKNSNWAKHRKVWCAEHISSSGLWCRFMSKLFSLHSLAKAQQFCCVQTIICKDLCFCLPQMMYLYKKAEGNWPSHWEMLVLVPNPMWASEHQYSKEVQEKDRTHLWSAFPHGFPPFPKSRAEITRMQMCSVGKGVEWNPPPLGRYCLTLARFIHLRSSSVLEILVF